MNASPLKLFVKPERRFVAEGRPTELLVLVRITPSGTAAGEAPVPVNLAVVVDLACSEEALEAQRNTVRQLAERLNPGDRLCVVGAGDEAERIVDLGAVNRAGVATALANLQTTTTSHLFAGWYLAALALAETLQPAAVNRILVLSAGGRPSPHTMSREAVLRAARGLHRRGIGTSTLGFGNAIDEDLLVPLAMECGGHAWYAERLSELAPLAIRELANCHATWCEWSSVRFDTDGADVVELLNPLPWVGTNKVSLPSLHAGAAMHLVARIRLSPTVAGEDMVPLTVRLKALNLEGSEALVFRKGLRIHVVAPTLADGMEPDLAVQAHAARMQLARTYRRCLEKLDAGDLNGVRSLLDFAVAQFRGLSGQQGGTLLTQELHTAVRLRECAGDAARRGECRRLLRYGAFWASRSDVGEH